MTGPDRSLEDQASRREINELLDETLFVEAGAGTGKTQALVDRYVALVLAGRPVERLIAITFTEKAAAELRDRVRGELERLAALETSSEVIDSALASLDRAQISTIHAFARAVLRSYAVEAGIDPAFEVQDEVAAERRFEEQWRSYLEGIGDDVLAVGVVGRCLQLGMTTANLEALASELWEHTAVAAEIDAAPLTAPPANWPDLEAMLGLVAALDLASVPADDPLRVKIEAVLRLIELLLQAPEAERGFFLAAGAKLLETKWGVSTLAVWGGSARIAQARRAASEVCEALAALLAALRGEALAALMPLIVRFVQADARARCREGKLVFDDLILRLRDILRDNPQARFELRSRFDAMLIDEFQDTDPLQVDIALGFARRQEDGRIEPGRLFLVGDPKQSIYRFRRADMAVYERTRRAAAAAAGRFPLLSLNRRSRPGVIDWVNAVFAAVIGDGDQPAVQPPYRAISAARDDTALAGPAVAWFGGETETTARELRRIEARQTAARCQAAVRERWQVVDRETGAVRAAAYRDIAVLIPTRTVLQPLEQALAAAGIPYRVEGGSLVYGTQEVRDLINCLTAIDDPTDEVAVVAALRSPAYACSDVDLARHKQAGGSFNYLSPALEAVDGRVAEGLRSLRAFHDRRHLGRLATLAEAFIDDRRLIEIGVYDSGNRNSFRRARFVVEQARAFEAARPESLRAFVAWLERRAGDAILDHEGAGLDDDEDAVRVLTVHGAKGLEFPIVFLGGLGLGPSNRTSLLNVDRATERIAISTGSARGGNRFTLGAYDEVSASEKAHLQAERNRLLYVAATRARDHLVLSLFHRPGAKDNAAYRLIEAGACGLAEELPSLTLIEVGSTRLGDLVVELPEVSEEAFAAQRDQLVTGGRRAVYTSATALGRQASVGIGDETERTDESEPWARGRAGTHRGRAVHAALQSLAWDADDEMIAAVARAQAVAEAVPGEAGRIADLVRHALGTDAAARARVPGRALREVPFVFDSDGVFVEGFVDVVIEAPDGSLEIVDWKTDAVPEAAVETRLREYELQAGLYVLGLQEATGRPVSRVTYVFIDPLVERSPGEPAALAAQARERLAAGIMS